MSGTQATDLSSLKDICRCCHSNGSFKSLKEPYKFRRRFEVYYQMLKETFGILITHPKIETSYSICDDCIIRLRDSNKFRDQVESCEKKFNHYCQLLQKPKESNDHDSVTVVEFKNENYTFVHVGNDIVNIDDKVENVNNEIKNEYVMNVEDELINGDEIQDGSDEVKNLDEDPNTRDNLETPVDCLKEHSNRLKNEKLYRCVCCLKQFISKNLLKIHFKEHILKKYKCNKCGQYFESLTRFKKHSRNIHNKCINKDKNVRSIKPSNYLECRFCKKRVCEYYYERHLKTHVGETECINCGEIFDSIDLLKEHSTKHQYENMCTCDFCKKRFTGKSTLKRHIDLHHMGKGRKFMCEECGMFFNDITNFRAHTTTVHQKLRIFECMVCQKKLASKKTLKVHMRTHTGERPYVCDECGDGFICFTRLKIHKIKHDIIKKYGTKYVCNICKTTFHKQALLTHHVRSEHPERLRSNDKYKRKYLPCPLCKQVFTQKYSLDRHMTKHGDIVKVSCELCNKMLTDKFSLIRHIRNIHTKEKVIKDKVQCNLCKRKVHDIGSHVKIHTVRPMKCQICGKNYPNEAILHRHVMNVHQGVNKIFQCNKCDRRPYSRKEHLRSHTLKNHGCDLKADEE